MSTLWLERQKIFLSANICDDSDSWWENICGTHTCFAAPVSPFFAIQCAFSHSSNAKHVNSLKGWSITCSFALIIVVWLSVSLMLLFNGRLLFVAGLCLGFRVAEESKKKEKGRRRRSEVETRHSRNCWTLEPMTFVGKLSGSQRPSHSVPFNTKRVKLKLLWSVLNVNFHIFPSKRVSCFHNFSSWCFLYEFLRNFWPPSG